MQSFDRRQILGAGALMVPLLGVSGRALSQVAPTERYGMVEIGSKGLKVNAYRFGRQKIADDEGTGPSGHERFAPSRIGKGYTVNTNPLSGDHDNLDSVSRRVINDTALAAAAAVSRLTSSEFGVPRDHIAIVASSGVASFPNVLELLSSEVLAQTHQTMDSVTPAKEAQLSYDWIVLASRRKQVLLVDIGSGNTKGGYYEQVGTKQQRFRDFSVPLGTGTLASAIRKEWPSDPVYQRAQTVFERNYLPTLNGQINAAPGIMTRPRIYLSGGIFWATAWLTRPAAMARLGDWVRLGSREFETLGSMIAAGDPYKLARTTDMTPAELEMVNKQATAISEAFDSDQLAAGNALCRALAKRLDFESRSLINFASFAVDAWSSQYLVGKFHTEQLED